MTSPEHSEDLAVRLRELAARGLRRDPRIVDSLPNGRCRIDGQELVNFGSNDYLGLAHDVRVTRAFANAAQQQAGSGASSLVTGRSAQHAELERRLAEFEECESVLLFPTGYAANVGTIQALSEADDLLLSERENHASLIDGTRISPATVAVFDRHDLAALRRDLQQRRSDFRRVWMVTDGVFSMDGTVAPLADLCDVADEFDAAVIVDEAHGTGVLGTHGRGAGEVCGVESRTFVRVGTLSKALGAMGGFVAGDGTTIEWLRNRARSQFFSTALPPAVCAAAIAALDIVISEPERRTRLSVLNRTAREIAEELGLNVFGNGAAPVIPIVIADPTAAVKLSEALQEQGWFVPAMRPPTVPAGTSRLRLSLTAVHTEADVEDVLRTAANLVS